MVRTKEFDFDWDALWAATEGRSYLDVRKLSLRSKQEAKQFLHAYGYDVDDPLVREEIWKIYFEALSFLRDALLDDGEEIPEEFLARGTQSDVLRLLQEASKKDPDATSRWSCALLRIMHIISHLDNDVRSENFRHAREQIFERFDSYVSKVEGQRLWTVGEGAGSVNVIRYLKKERKDRNSTLIKLLSKPDAMVEAIYDRIGFRFVTETRWEAFQLLRVLVDVGLIAAPNIYPQRSLNTLIPTDEFRDFIEDLKHRLKGDDWDESHLNHSIQQFESESVVSLKNIRNRFSSSWYRAIQFTCRQLIVAPDPTFSFWNGLKQKLMKEKVTQALLKKIPITLREKNTFYYPFEVQILDKASYVEAIGGRSRHREYKARQRLMARNRVLRDLF